MKSKADYNLLFGILALQMDFVSREQLVAAMNAWVLEKSTPLGEILLRQKAFDKEERQLLEALVNKHLAKLMTATRKRAWLRSVRSTPLVMNFGNLPTPTCRPAWCMCLGAAKPGTKIPAILAQH